MYSKSFVGLPKKGVPSGFGTWGESRMSEAASVRGVSACGRDPGERDERGAQAFSQDRAHLGGERAVADVEEVDAVALEPARGPRRSAGGSRSARTSVPCQVPNVPTNVSRSASAGTPSSSRARRLSVGREAVRVEDERVDAVRVEEHALARRAERHRLLDERPARPRRPGRRGAGWRARSSPPAPRSAAARPSGAGPRPPSR